MSGRGGWEDMMTSLFLECRQRYALSYTDLNFTVQKHWDLTCLFVHFFFFFGSERLVCSMFKALMVLTFGVISRQKKVLISDLLHDVSFSWLPSTQKLFNNWRDQCTVQIKIKVDFFFPVKVERHECRWLQMKGVFKKKFSFSFWSGIIFYRGKKKSQDSSCFLSALIHVHFICLSRHLMPSVFTLL